MKSYFRVEFMGEAEEFMEQLDLNTCEKVYYNIRKARHIKDKELFAPLARGI